ncbi:SDR family oxidoreductase [Qaidamihabitans albus]|uniref:SDR family oxidoreductase n=1 Tax=Qaidamihabitans albus TaxID=2795733 RepID=UPI0027DE21CF|nr:NAD(P)H-binding protein [Qaidamihabitans albus]
MSRIAVAGATGTLGSRIRDRLSSGGHTVVPISRSAGVDLHTGEGLAEALSGVDVVVDASNAFPTDPSADLVGTLAGATRRLLEVAEEMGVERGVVVSISNVESPAFDHVPYYVAKREQEKIVAASGLRTSMVKTTQWHEFATNPAAVTLGSEEVLVQDWLIQPVAADAVAEVVADHALDRSTPARVELAGPEQIRLPTLTRRLLSVRQDDRPVRIVPPGLPALSDGVLLAPESAEIVGPTVAEWLEVYAGHRS